MGRDEDPIRISFSFFFLVSLYTFNLRFFFQVVLQLDRSVGSWCD